MLLLLLPGLFSSLTSSVVSWPVADGVSLIFSQSLLTALAAWGSAVGGSDSRDALAASRLIETGTIGTAADGEDTLVFKEMFIANVLDYTSKLNPTSEFHLHLLLI